MLPNEPRRVAVGARMVDHHAFAVAGDLHHEVIRASVNPILEGGQVRLYEEPSAPGAAQVLKSWNSCGIWQGSRFSFEELSWKFSPGGLEGFVRRLCAE